MSFLPEALWLGLGLLIGAGTKLRWPRKASAAPQVGWSTSSTQTAVVAVEVAEPIQHVPPARPDFVPDIGFCVVGDDSPCYTDSGGEARDEFLELKSNGVKCQLWHDGVLRDWWPR